MVKGKSHHDMEDYVVAQFRNVNDKELGLFAIFDGHLGYNVADYLQSHLFDNILKQVRVLDYPSQSSARTIMKDAIKQICASRRSFGPTHELRSGKHIK